MDDDSEKALPDVEFPSGNEYQWREFERIAEIAYEIQLDEKRTSCEYIETVIAWSPYVGSAYANKVNKNFVGVYYSFLEAMSHWIDCIPKKAINRRITYSPKISWTMDSASASFQKDGHTFSMHDVHARLRSSLVIGIAICRDETRIAVYAMRDQAEKRFEEIKQYGYVSVTDYLKKKFPKEKLQALKTHDFQIKFDTENFPWRKDKRPVIELPKNLLWDVPKDRKDSFVIAGQDKSSFFGDKNLALCVLESPYLPTKGFGVYLNNRLQSVFSHYLGAASYMDNLAKNQCIKEPAYFRKDIPWASIEVLNEDWAPQKYFPNAIPITRNLQTVILHNEEDDIIAFGLFEDGNLAGVFMALEEAMKEMRSRLRHYALSYLGNTARANSD